jgi:hypothetical protein
VQPGLFVQSRAPVPAQAGQENFVQRVRNRGVSAETGTMKRKARHLQIMANLKLLTAARQQTREPKKLRELNQKITALKLELNKL